MRQADQLFLNIMTAVDQDNREAFAENFLELRDHLLEGWEPPVVQSLGMVGNRPKEIMPCYSIDCAIMSRVVGDISQGFDFVIYTPRGEEKERFRLGV